MNEEKVTLEFCDVYTKLEKFVWWLANQKKLENVPLMDQDEIAGELFLELWKGFQYYQYRIFVLGEMCAVIRRMLDNRVRELIHRFTGTHRGDALYGKSIERDTFYVEAHTDVSVTLDISVAPFEVSSFVEYEDNMDTVRQRLSETATVVFDAVSGGYHPVIKNHILLASKRSKGIDAEVYVRPWHIGDAVGMDTKAVKEALLEIKTVYTQVHYGR